MTINNDYVSKLPPKKTKQLVTDYIGTTPVYTTVTIAECLNVDPSTVHNWRRRYNNCPLPAFEIKNKNGKSVPGWDGAGMVNWRHWFLNHIVTDLRGTNQHAK